MNTQGNGKLRSVRTEAYGLKTKEVNKCRLRDRCKGNYHTVIQWHLLVTA